MDFWEQCLFYLYKNMDGRYFLFGFDGKPPTIDSMLRDYIHAMNEEFDKDYKLQNQNYIIALSANLKEKDLKSLKPTKPNYLIWNVEKWSEFLDEYQITQFYT